MFGSVLGISADEELPEEITSRLTIEGNASLEDDEETATQSDTAFDVSFSVGADSLDEVVGIEFRQVDGESYVYGRALPNLAFLPLESFAGQWIGLGESPASNFTSETQLETTETELSSETYRKIFTAVADSDVFIVDEVSQVTTEGGVDVFHYDIVMDSSAIPALQTEIERIIEEDEPEFAASAAYQDFQEQVASYEDTITRIDEMADGLSFWVAEDTLFFQRIRIDSSFTGAELRELSPDTDYTGITGIDGSIELSFSDHNEPVDISAPEDARPLEEIMSGMFGGGAGMMQPSGL
jgi:predicted ester cyclase